MCPRPLDERCSVVYSTLRNAGNKIDCDQSTLLLQEFYHRRYRHRLLIVLSAHIIADVYSASRLALPHTLKQKTPSLSISGSWKRDVVIAYIWSFQDPIPLISLVRSFVNEHHEGIAALWDNVTVYDLAWSFICYLVLISYYIVYIRLKLLACQPCCIYTTSLFIQRFLRILKQTNLIDFLCKT